MGYLDELTNQGKRKGGLPEIAARKCCQKMLFVWTLFIYLVYSYMVYSFEKSSS